LPHPFINNKLIAMVPTSIHLNLDCFCIDYLLWFMSKSMKSN